MPKYNTQFDLSLDDMEMIETALQHVQSRGTVEPRQVSELLGRLHNQKVFYRPKGNYVSG